MQSKNIFKSLIFIFLVYACSNDNEEKSNYTISGYAQKGPYQTGSNITVLELKSSLQPTGLNFYSTVSDNLGSFMIPDVELTSHYIELMAEGYYFNENRGRTTDEKLLLKAIADVSLNSEININVLTHISVERIKYLVQNEGKTFSEAKTQAQNEILKIFNLEGDETNDYEKLDITKSGELNSKLLAVSSIIQDNKSIPALTEFITEIGLDIKKDGVIDSKELQTKLATSAVLCNVGGMRKHLADYYDNDSAFNDFQNDVKYFIETTEFESMVDLDFPLNAPEGINLLALPDNAILDTASVYCLTLNISVSNLSRFSMIFTILKISGSGTIKYSENDLAGWQYETKYCSNEPLYGFCCGIALESRFATSASDTPLTIELQGSGEIMLTIYIESESLPDNGGLYIINKWFRW